MMNNENVRAIKKAHSKAKFVGFLYLIATLFIAVMAFAPLVTGTAVGTMYVANFWKPFLDLKLIKDSFIPVFVNVLVSALYAVLLLTMVINAIRIMSNTGRVYKKFTRKSKNANINVVAMEKSAAIFSGTLCFFIVAYFMMHMILNARFTPLFYLTVVIGLIFHLWAGFVGAKVSHFDSKNGNEELARKLGRGAPFFRNVAQLVFVGLIMFFISKSNTIMVALKWFETNAFADLFKGSNYEVYLYGVQPLIQLIICFITIVLLKHATAATEFNKDGKKGKGMKNFCVFSVILFIFAGLSFGLTYYASVKVSNAAPMVSVFNIAVVAIAAIIEEACMAKLPNVRGKVVEEKTEKDKFADIVDNNVVDNNANVTENVPVDNIVATEANVENKEEIKEENKDNQYHIALQSITQPGIFMQPNGMPVLIMPMVPGAQPVYPRLPENLNNQPQNDNPYMNPYVNPYANSYSNPYFQRGQNPYQYVEEPVVNDDYNEAESGIMSERAAVEEALKQKWMSKARKPEDEPVENIVKETVVEEKKEESVVQPKTKKELKAEKKKEKQAKKNNKYSTVEQKPVVEEKKEEVVEKSAEDTIQLPALSEAHIEELDRKNKELAEKEAQADKMAEEVKLARNRIMELETKLADETKKVEEAVKLEETRKADDARRFEIARIIEETRKADAAKLAEDNRIAENVMRVMETQSSNENITYQPRFGEYSQKLEDGTLEREMSTKVWNISCPFCKAKLNVNEGANAYRCPKCGKMFQLRKSVKSALNNIVENNKAETSIEETPVNEEVKSIEE